MLSLTKQVVERAQSVRSPRLSPSARADGPALAQDKPSHPGPVIIVGAGPVGMRTAQELLRRDDKIPLVIFGDEPWEPYNRVRLSSLLSGELSWAATFDRLTLPAGAQVTQHFHCPVVGIDRDNRKVTDSKGAVYPYVRLILATGSRAHMPAVPGIALPGVFKFRDLNDAQLLLARRVRTRHTIVIGGGLLGLEAARAMQRFNTEVTVVEHSPRLMNRQLDAGAAERLREHLMTLGLRVVLHDSVRRIIGEQSVQGVELRSGRTLDCDTVVVATGIVPNVELALQAKLSVGRGIRVNDHMQTSDPRIYAVGECAEHRGQVYGLVGPGFEQAAVAAHGILVGRARYQGSIAAARLKVVGQPVFSMGPVTDDDAPRDAASLVFERPSAHVYRKLIIKRGRLLGAVALGNWDQLGRLQEAITRRRMVWPWQRRRFRRDGNLWPAAQLDAIAHWPAGTVICNCTGVTRGALSRAIDSGCTTLSSVVQCTGASSVCGSCRPLVVELVGDSALSETTREQVAIQNVSIAALVMAVLTCLMPAIGALDSVQATVRWDVLWTDGLVKQISGYSLLGLSLVGLLLSLRKRVKRFKWGEVANWQVIHVVLGAAILIGLFAHTGFSLGENLNKFLVLDFIALLLVGAVGGVLIGLQPRLRAGSAKKWRDRLLWAHILAFWPLPILLAFHITSVYYF